MPLSWMRNPDLVGISAIATGLVEMCEYMKATIPLGIMYELGSFAGESTEVFARYFAVVHAVDPWDNAWLLNALNPNAEHGKRPEDVESSFDERAKAAGNIIKHKCTSEAEALNVEAGSLDFAYLDAGDHSYDRTVRDFLDWWPRIKSGGFLGGHDWYIPEIHAADVFPGVNQAVYYVLGQHPEVYGLKVFPDTSWIVRRP